jgi:murein DD-endopeptidase MepM/ murein hydrolase activator NlpD
VALRRSLPAAALLSAAIAGGVTVAYAEAPATGGASAPDATEIDTLGCATAWSCATGETLTVRGRGLDGVQALEFLGGRGRTDNRTARPLQAGAKRLTVVVPREARTGRVRAITDSGNVRTAQALTITAGTQTGLARGAGSGGVFPIDGRHDMGQSETNRFGGGRGHQGQDLFARCGTPVVAVLDSKVQFVGRHSAAGNYVVLQDASKRSYAYMHLRDRPLVRKGDTVTAGERVGFVGDTGRASGCHLHFEIWTAPGWYEGGDPIDPLPQLRAWEAEHEH